MNTTLAILTDLHGNHQALQAILQDIRKDPCQEILHLGDAIALGPQPRETLEGLIAAKATLLMGNHEAYYLARGAELPAYVHPGEWAHQRWTYAAVGEGHLPRVRGLPFQVERIFGKLSFRFLHYPMEEGPPSGLCFKPIQPLARGAEADALFRASADVVFFGHHHGETDLHSRDTRTRYVNPGSAGCSRDALARYVRLTVSGDSFQLEHRALPYDKSAMVAAMLEKAVPQGEFLLKFFHGVEEDDLPRCRKSAPPAP